MAESSSGFDKILARFGWNLGKIIMSVHIKLRGMDALLGQATLSKLF